MKISPRFRTPALVACVATSALALFVSLATSADTICKKPSPNEKFCKTLENATGDCNDNDNTTSARCTLLPVLDRKQFPKGSADNPTGTVKEELADCWRSALCVWDADTKKCNMPVTWGNWFKEDKVVTGTNPCPGS